jgi:hypothetical protein
MKHMTAPEIISQDGTILALIIRSDVSATETTFFTSHDSPFQVGFVVYPAAGAVVPHVHLPVVREVVGTSELLVVRSGRCIMDVYDADRQLVCSRELLAGDTVLSIGGGHGFRMLEDTVLFELKQGPYAGGAEKDRFGAGPSPEQR